MDFDCLDESYAMVKSNLYFESFSQIVLTGWEIGLNRSDHIYPNLPLLVSTIRYPLTDLELATLSSSMKFGFSILGLGMGRFVAGSRAGALRNKIIEQERGCTDKDGDSRQIRRHQ